MKYKCGVVYPAGVRMISNWKQKLHSRSGVAWLIGLAVLAVLVLLVIVLLPTIRHYRYEARAAACMASLDTARRQLANESMLLGEVNKEAEARDYVASVMPGWSDLCPGGGTTYIVPADSDPPYWTVICGMHGTDKKQCTRLNADYVLRQLRENLKTTRDEGKEYPETLTYFLNGKTREATLVHVSPGVRRGTSSTMDMKSIVAFYTIRGAGESDDLAGYGTSLKNGEISHFWFADEDYCAIWHASGGWSGDSWTR